MEITMKYSYNKLWKMLIDKNMSKRELCRLASVSESTIVRMKHGDQVGANILIKLTATLGCGLEDIFEIKMDK